MCANPLQQVVGYLEIEPRYKLHFFSNSLLIKAMVTVKEKK